MGSTSKPPRPRLRIDLRTALHRLPLVLGLTAAMSLVALTIAWSSPATLPPDISTGVAVGLAAWLVAFTLAAVTRDPSPSDRDRGDDPRDVPPEERAPVHPPHDLRVLRTPQDGPSMRIRTSGAVRRFGQTEALPLEGDRRRCTADLATHLLEQAGDEPIQAAVGPLDDHLAGRGWATGLAEELARAGRKVLLIDLAPPSERLRPGIPEVVAGEVDLDGALEYHRSLRIARLGPGGDRRSAAAELPAILADLPEGVDAVIVQLPQMGGATVATTARHIAHLVFVAVRGHTRVGTVRRTESVSREDLALTIALVDPAHGAERPVAWDPAPMGADGRPMAGTETAPADESRATPPNRGDIWRRELAHASEEIDTTLGDGLDPDDVWGTDGDTLRDRPPSDDEEVPPIDPASVWAVDGEEPSRSMSPSTDARGTRT